MTDSPIITLVLPCFNAEAYLDQCLDSIARQSFADFRVIIVDDGSYDDSPAIARRRQAADPRFALVASPHGGVSHARNIGIDLARSRYIGFVDADDMLLPDALATLLDALRRHDAQVAVGAHIHAASLPPSLPGCSRAPLVMDYTTAIRRALYQKILINAPWAMLMERSLLDPDVRFDETVRYEDLDAFYRFYERASRIVYLHSPVYFYRRAAGSFMEQWSDSRLDVLDVTDRLVEYMRANHPRLVSAALDRRFAAHYNMYLTMRRYAVDNPDALRRCRRVINAGRLRAIIDPNVRLKNKLGALLPLLR